LPTRTPHFAHHSASSAFMPVDRGGSFAECASRSTLIRRTGLPVIFSPRFLAFTLPCPSLPEPSCSRAQDLRSGRRLRENTPPCPLCGHPPRKPFARRRLRQFRGIASACQEHSERACSLFAIMRKCQSSHMSRGCGAPSNDGEVSHSETQLKGM